ncbi:MAG: HNH endonuclease [Phycisphaerales bacterium]|nr:HNH endonuclease [Phycisphaerales bacterium]
MSSIPHSMIETPALQAQVLVLNRVYTAIKIVDARRAFTLLAKQIAEVVALEEGTYRNYDLHSWTDIAELQKELEADAHEWVSTARISIAVPKIIRLLDYDRRPHHDVKLNRRNIYARDESRCQYCGRKHTSKELSLDHVLPRVQGGEDSWTNLVCACVKCNARKGGRTPRQANMRLIREPRKPRRNPAITIRVGAPRYKSWKAFLDEAYWTVELA